MKKFLLRSGFLVVLAVSCLALSASPANKHRVLLIARLNPSYLDFMLANEVLPMIALLEKSGYKVDVASENGQAMVSTGHRLEVDLKLADCRITDYSGLLLPCMGMGNAPRNATPPALRLVDDAIAASLPIAAQNALELLAPSGILRSKSFAARPGVVRDGFLVTSYNCPVTAQDNSEAEDTAKLMETFIALMDGQ